MKKKITRTFTRSTSGVVLHYLCGDASLSAMFVGYDGIPTDPHKLLVTFTTIEPKVIYDRLAVSAYGLKMNRDYRFLSLATIKFFVEIAEDLNSQKFYMTIKVKPAAKVKK